LFAFYVAVNALVSFSKLGKRRGRKMLVNLVLTHIIQSDRRVFVDIKNVPLTLRLTSVTGLSTWTHNARRETSFSQ